MKKYILQASSLIFLALSGTTFISPLIIKSLFGCIFISFKLCFFTINYL